MNILGIIPARGGSKGVPRKNIKLLGGKPLIAYTIEAAQGSKHLKKVVVSTEDQEIAEVTRRFGCEVVERPDEFATDGAAMLPVIQHALEVEEEKQGMPFDGVYILQPTTPFRTSDDIDQALELFAEVKPESVIGVVQIFDQHPVRVKKIEDGRLQPFCLPEDEGSRRQDLAPAYLRNGAVYVIRRDVIAAGKIRGEDQLPMEMPAERSVNIDEPLDFLLAEAVLGQLKD